MAYADDLTRTVSGSSQTENISRLNSCLRKVTEYTRANKLAINQGKTELIVMARPILGKKLEALDMKLDVKNEKGEFIGLSNEVRLLGLKLSKDLRWENQI